MVRIPHVAPPRRRAPRRLRPLPPPRERLLLPARHAARHQDPHRPPPAPPRARRPHRHRAHGEPLPAQRGAPRRRPAGAAPPRSPARSPIPPGPLRSSILARAPSTSWRTLPAAPVTLIVVDGTWSQTRKVVRDNPELAALPRYAFTPRERRASTASAGSRTSPASRPSRRSSTCWARSREIPSAAARSCSRSGPWSRRSSRARGACTTAGAGRGRRGRGACASACRRGSASARTISVCVVGEANAWPYRSQEREADYPDELVHWVARRLATGETFDLVDRAPEPAVVEDAGARRSAPGGAPRGRDALHVPRAVAGVRAGHGRALRLGAVRDASSWRARGAICRPRCVDVRQLARDASGGKVGTVEEYRAPWARLRPRGSARDARGFGSRSSSQIVRSLAARAGEIAA